MPFLEPEYPRYVHVNPANNLVHLFFPVVGGHEISTDNTCQTDAAPNSFEQNVVGELNKYKRALERDLQLLSDEEAEKAPKQQRLTQINAYLAAINDMGIGICLSSLLPRLKATQSNLYGLRLKTTGGYYAARVFNLAFSVDLANSTLFNALFGALQNVQIGRLDPRAQFVNAVTYALRDQLNPDFATIRGVLSEQWAILFEPEADFTRNLRTGEEVTQETIERDLWSNLTTGEYIDGLIGNCGSELLDNLSIPPFYSVESHLPARERGNKRAIITQFFLAHVNIYCRSNNITDRNFGEIFDASPALSNELTLIVESSLTAGVSVEENVADFFNHNFSEQNDFGLRRLITAEEINTIKAKFERTYRVVKGSATHMEEFMILDMNAVNGKYISHQGAICTDFSELRALHYSRNNASADAYFQSIRDDFRTFTERNIPGANDLQAANTNVLVAEEILQKSRGVSAGFLALAAAAVVTAALFTALILAAEMTWLLAMACAFPVGIVAGAFVGLSFFNSGDNDDKGPEPGDDLVFYV